MGTRSGLSPLLRAKDLIKQTNRVTPVLYWGRHWMEVIKLGKIPRGA